MNVYSTPYLAEKRLQQEYIPPHQLQPKPDPRVLRAPEQKSNRIVRVLCDTMLTIALEIKDSDDDCHKAELTLEVLVICTLLQKLGYQAQAGLGRQLFIAATRLPGGTPHLNRSNSDKEK